MMRTIGSKLQSLPKLSSRLSTIRYSSELFVSRLSFYTTDSELHHLFSPFGKVEEARLVMDSDTGRPKGFGFVTFEKETEAKEAIKGLDGRIVQGRLIFVEFAGKVNG